ncbi:hypothetical protein CCHL11_00181, partial [Colletotrichum chlorophyti]
INPTADFDSFGPRLAGSFDFTLLFLQSILSIVSSALFLAIAPYRITWLFRRPPLVRSNWLLWTKLTVSAAYFCLQLAIVVLWALPATFKTLASFPAAILALLDSIAIGVLVHTEQKRSIRPSKILSIFLLISVLVDLPQAKSLFLQTSLNLINVAGLSVAALATKLTLLLLEEVPKKTLSNESSGEFATESTSGPLNRSIFGWLNPLFFKGARNLLRIDDLASIDHKFDSARLLSSMAAAWDKCDRTAKHGLLTAILSTFRVGYVAPVLARLCLAAFSFSQPFLIK